MKKLLFLLVLLVPVGFIACEFFLESRDFKITFDANGGTGGPTSVTATHSKPMPTLSAHAPVRTGYFFIGYYDTDAQTGGTRYYFSDLTSITDWDKKHAATLYARWLPTTEPSIVSMVRSSEARASDLTPGDIKELVVQAVELAGGLDDIIKTGDTVVLKPNLITTHYNWGTGATIPVTVNGVCTDWRVVKAVSEIVRDIIGPAGRILVIEGSGSGISTVQNFINAGYTPTNLDKVDQIIALDNEGTWGDKNSPDVTRVELVNFLYNTASGTYYNYYKNDGVYYVNKKMYEADAIICLPVLKNHWNAVVTGSIKNMAIGAAPPRIYGVSSTNIGRNSMVNHDTISFHQWMADYFSVLPADFTIMDALQGLERGPLPSAAGASALAGFQKNMRTILASKDALAIDIVQTNIMNWDYSTVRYLEYLTERGRAGVNPNKPEVLLNGYPKNIIVRGNVTVGGTNGIRRNFAGNLPMSGGNPLSAAQLTPPTLSIVSASFENQNLLLNLNVSNNTDKVDIFINNEYFESYNEDMTNINIDASTVGTGTHNIMVRSYNRFMSHNEASITRTKN